MRMREQLWFFCEDVQFSISLGLPVPMTFRADKPISSEIQSLQATTLTNLNTKLAENIDPKNQRQGPFQNLISYGTDERTIEPSLL